MISGIYMIDSTSGGIYIGSSNDIERRWYEHKKILRGNRHHSKKLQRAWNKYGENAFNFSILEECDVLDNPIKEQSWLDILFIALDRDKIYNIAANVQSPTLGIPRSVETKKAISDKLKGHKIWLGKHHSEETLLKLSKTWIFENPEGKIVEIINLCQFCRVNNLTNSAMYHVYYGNRKSHKGWTKA